MLATTGDPPPGEGHQVEFKWDGVRAVVACHGGEWRLWTRNGRERSVAWPELAGLPAALPVGDAVLDGEVITFDPEGRPRFGLLQHRMHVTGSRDAVRLAAALPASLVVFDVLRLEGRPTIALPLEERRRLLEALEISGPSWAVSPAFVGAVAPVLDAARERGLEGVVAKRLGSSYRPGTRAPEWVKVKLLQRDDFVVGGWYPGSGRRSTGFGSLALGERVPGGLRYVGRVGTGFTEATLADLTHRLAALATTQSPFVDGPDPGRDLQPVQPALIVEVAYGEWTSARVLRHPSYVGIRTDLMSER